MSCTTTCRPALRALCGRATRSTIGPTVRQTVRRPHADSRPHPLSTSTARATQTTTDRPPPPPARGRGAISDFVAQVGGSGVVRSATEPYAAYAGTEALFAECARQAHYTVPNVLEKPARPAPRNEAGEELGVGEGLWFTPRVEGGLGLPVTFMTWAQVMYLHMYVLTVRLRRFPAAHERIWEQHLLDHFSYAAEDRMVKWHGMVAKGVRNKNLKDLWLQWRGVLVSYDEGLIRGDAMLAAAVWRAIFKGREDVDVGDVALVTAYLREKVQRLDDTADEDVARGRVRFGGLAAVRSALQARGGRGDGLPAGEQATAP